MTKPCKCGSGNDRQPLYDARGIFCTYVCSSCIASVKAKYRPEIFSDAQYEADEEIEPEELPGGLRNDLADANRVDGYDRDDLGESPDY